MSRRDNIQNEKMLSTLIEIGRAFSSDKSFSNIFQDLMFHARNITGAEGGSLYLYDRSQETLKVVVLTNDKLGINKTVSEFNPTTINGFIEVPMISPEDGHYYLSNVTVCSVRERQKYLISDLESNYLFDFSKTREFDVNNNYKTKNLAVFPLLGHLGDVVGAIQLVNSHNEVFDGSMDFFLETLMSQIGIVLNNALLVNELQNLLRSLVSMIGVAIDEKSPHTAGHCQRVTDLTIMISEEMINSKDGIYANFDLSKDEKRELEIAAMLHDVGKIVTPMHVMEKPTKLHQLTDRIEVLYNRFWIWKLSEERRCLEEKIKEIGREDILENLKPTKWDGDYEFLYKLNRGEIYLDDDNKKRLDNIATRAIIESDDSTLVPEGDYENLKVKRGTLNSLERKIMEDHVSISIRLLSSIPWPRNLQKVVEYAGAHHENINGKGYPNQLTGDQLSLQAKMLGLADRFEGLSAPDRPYRKVKMTLSRVLQIMNAMAESGEIDADLYSFFISQNIHKKYAERFLPKELIDC